MRLKMTWLSRTGFYSLLQSQASSGGSMRFSAHSNVEQVVAGMGRRMTESRAAIKRGLRNARPQTDRVLTDEVRSVMKVRDGRMDHSWRLGIIDDGMTMRVKNLMRGFEMHVTGGTISPKRGSALLIPINTYLGGHIGTKKFYKLIDWLQHEKLTLIRNNVLYVRVPMNTSRRGGVAAGSRVQKTFRARFQGSKRRPSGFGIRLNAQGLTPIAIVKRSINLRARFNVDSVTQRRIMPIIVASVRAEMNNQT
jgi:hypothetical protein